MNCETTRQLLPWWENGTLEPTEREAVAGHLEACDACRRELADTRTAAAVYAAHLPTDALVAHAFGEEPGIDRQLVERHLESCPRCAEELALVRASRQALAADEAAAREEESGQTAPPPVVDFTAARARRHPAAPAPTGWRRLALAASLAGLVFLGAWWGTWLYGTGQRASYEGQIARLESEIAELRAAPASGESAAEIEQLLEELEGVRAAQRELDERVKRQEEQIAGQEEEIGRLSRPQLARVIDVYPVDRRLRGEAERQPVIPADGAESVVLLLDTRLAPGTRGLTAEVVDAAGRTIATVPRLAVGDDGLSLTLPRKLLPAGELTLDLYAPGKKLLESYPFQVE